ncbi:MAG: thioredoxin family protein [Bacteroidales bacterium]|jgi:thiol:disulfide interchange protein DsbD|nr:thioredoxin family protein [Bacteroidales bacterium]
MKSKFLISLALVFASIFSISQSVVAQQAAPKNPVKWKYTVEYVEKGEAVLVFTAKIDKEWHLYSQFLEAGGPLPTVFNLSKSSNYTAVGKISESPKPKEGIDDVFGTKIAFFAGNATFKQRIKINSQDDFKVTGTIDYQVCNEETCIPFTDIDFSFDVKVSEPVATATVEDTLSIVEAALKEIATNSGECCGTHFINAAEDSAANDTEGISWGFIITAILMGLLAVLTPCVFPMIPMTVSFFIDNSSGAKGRSKGILKGLIFALSVTFIYTAVGGIVAITKSADFANVLSTHWIPNLIFFALFILFAMSFFGLFELTLPSGLSTKLDAKADRGGYVASFFMAAVLVLVSFACTGPFVAALLVEAAMGTSVLKPLIGMFCFGLALGLPFFIFSLFPALLDKMPRSGGWLNSVKVVFAFLLVAFGMKFLVTIDQGYGFDIITRDAYIAIWIVLFALLGFYLLGKIKFSHDSDVQHIGVFRLFLVIAVFSFTVYLIPGLFGAPLKMVAPLLPPSTAQQFNVGATANAEFQVDGAGMNNLVSLLLLSTTNTGISVGGTEQTLCGVPKYSDKLTLPYGLKGYFDYEEGLKCAKEQNKPVFLDFKGHACANCKKTETDIWSDPRVQEMLKKYIIIGLYCDDRTELPESEWVTSKIDGKVKNTMGKRNLNFEIERFKTNTLPFYHLLDTSGNPLVPAGIGYSPDLTVEKYLQFLQAGLDKFNEKNP